MIVAGMNGFGRFGVHLLKYWLDRSDRASFRIDYINDDTLSLPSAYHIILNDPYVVFDRYDVRLAEDAIIISKSSGTRHLITYTNSPPSEIPWLGKPHMLFECSGKETVAQMRRFYLSASTKLVIISATSLDADKTLIYGFNHRQLSRSHNIISYGSCTVNAYVPLADFLHGKFGVVDSDVHVIHNTPAYLLEGNMTLKRKACTLEVSAGRLLPFLNAQNFLVKYTVVPYTGVSMIDLRFRLKSQVSADVIVRELQDSFRGGELRGLYEFDDCDSGPQKCNCSTYSAVFIKNAVNVLGHNVYFQAYCDTENSANRFFDLADYVSIRNHSVLSRVDTIDRGARSKERFCDPENTCRTTA